MIQTLSFPVDTFDQKRTFTFEYSGWSGKTRTGTGYLLAAKLEGKIYIMQRSTCIKDSYTAADHEESERLAAMEPVRDGNVVMVDGDLYLVQILGNFSDAGILRPITPTGIAKAAAEMEEAKIDLVRKEIMHLEQQLANAQAELAVLQASAR